MTFNHPYQPYDIQVQLMQSIYDALTENKKITIVESPTGTGKTLSLICSTLSWLRDNKSKLIAGNKTAKIESQQLLDILDSIDSSDSDFGDEPDWVKESPEALIANDDLMALKDFEDYLVHINEKAVASELVDAKQRRQTKKRKLDHVEVKLDDEDFLPQNYDVTNDDDAVNKESKSSLLSNEVKTLLASFDAKDDKKNSDNSKFLSKMNPVKIYFASRTYSQLNQFASQLRLPNFRSSFDQGVVPEEKIKFLPLASRKQYCINPAVTQKWTSVEAVNEACKELLNSENGCPFYKRGAIDTTFRDHGFTNVHDIEDMIDIGNKTHNCPYYNTRNAVQAAEIISLPYQYLLSESTRTSMNLNLTNSIIVIDEAHNLIETITSIHSAQVSLKELETCQNGLNIYLQKFNSRLSARNRVNIIKLLTLINQLVLFIKQNYRKSGQKIDLDSIFDNSNADSLNIHELNKFIKASKIAFKIDNYLKSLVNENAQHITDETSMPLLFKVSAFLICLTNPKNEGQFYFEKNQSIQYMLLEPAENFKSIVNESRNVILAGGTMEPINEFLDNLFPEIPRNKITTFSCNHVIPDENLSTYSVSNSEFDFTFKNRDNPVLIDQKLPEFFAKLSDSLPKSGGFVAFFPSYQYLKQIIQSWKRAGVYSKLDGKRKIFYEEKNGSNPLTAYTELIEKGLPAFLFAVVGGKLSEGINFQDDLCRAVVVVGLPYPNVFSGEMQIKKQHLEKKVIGAGGSTEGALQATRNFYENLCMKAVNQSVGRAIRHANDYAIIYLLDKRYESENIRQKLSKWVRNRIQPQTSVIDIVSCTKLFFEQKRHA